MHILYKKATIYKSIYLWNVYNHRKKIWIALCKGVLLFMSVNKCIEYLLLWKTDVGVNLKNALLTLKLREKMKYIKNGLL